MTSALLYLKTIIMGWILSQVCVLSAIRPCISFSNYRKWSKFAKSIKFKKRVESVFLIPFYFHKKYIYYNCVNIPYLSLFNDRIWSKQIYGRLKYMVSTTVLLFFNLLPLQSKFFFRQIFLLYFGKGNFGGKYFAKEVFPFF